MQFLTFGVFQGLTIQTRRHFGVLACLILLFTIAHMCNSDSLSAQSASAISNSISAEQLATESSLSRPASSFDIRVNRDMELKKVLEVLGVPTFIDTNLEGVVDELTTLRMQTGVTMYKALQRALYEADARMIVESDGSILIISVDDELEPEYLRNVTYDITPLTPGNEDANALASSITNTISSDTWEQNGGGNGTLAFFHHNGRVLMTISNSYRVHTQIRSHLESYANLVGISRSRRTVFGNQQPASFSVASRTKHSKQNFRNIEKRQMSQIRGGGFGGGGLGGSF